MLAVDVSKCSLILNINNIKLLSYFSFGLSPDKHFPDHQRLDIRMSDLQVELRFRTGVVE